MPRYANLGGNSGVVSYETDADSITVTFKDGAVYRYDDRVPGKAVVERMKALAEAGQGLNAFISSGIRGKYSKKIV